MATTVSLFGARTGSGVITIENPKGPLLGFSIAADSVFCGANSGINDMTNAPDQPSQPRVCALNVVDHPDGGSQVGVVAKRTYLIRGGRCAVADEQVALVEAPRMSDDDSELLHDFDVALNRRQTDVIVLGKAHPPRKERSFEVRVRVGPLDRRLLVFGDRKVWRDSIGRLRFTDAEPVEELDLGWSSAYGGIDAIAWKVHGDPLEAFSKDAGQPFNPRFGTYAYPRNRTGKGYLIEASHEALAACALPNLEDPARLLSPERLAIGHPQRWPDGPPVAGLGWLSYASFPRTAMLGLPPPYDVAACPPEAFWEVKLGLLKAKSIAPVAPLQERFDLGAAQESAVGMRIADLAPGAMVELQSCHPKLAAWTFALPREVPTLALQMPDQRPIAPEPKIRTLLIEPELDRICVVWVAEHREPSPVGPGKQTHVKYGVKWTG